MSVCGFKNALKHVFGLSLFPDHFLSISNSIFDVWDFQIVVFASKVFKIDFSWKSFLKNFGIDF